MASTSLQLQTHYPLGIQQQIAAIGMALDATPPQVIGNDFKQSEVPEFLGSMHNLEYLNLSGTNVRGLVPYHLGNLSHLKSLDLSDNEFSLRVNNLDWLYGLSSLKELDLSMVQVSNGENWLHAINALPFLVELRLRACWLYEIPSYLPYVNITSLQILDLSFNLFEGTIPTWLFEIVHLQHLDLSLNELDGQIPNKFENLESLAILDLSYNFLSGSIPSTLGQIQLVRQSSLKELHLNDNNLFGRLEESLVQFSSLEVLDVSSNDLEEVESVDLSHNNLKGCVHNFSSNSNLDTLDLSNNNFRCPLPDHIPPTLRVLNLSRNSFYGPMSRICGILGVNKSLSSLDLSSNDLSGNIPNCWEKGKSLSYLFIKDNNLSGHIPSSFGYLENLEWIDMSNNNLSGEIPTSLQKCTHLGILNLSRNMLSGEIPNWVGESFQFLGILDLHSNALEGNIPKELCQLTFLRKLDLSGNHLSGTIPRTCVFTSMTRVPTIPFLSNYFFRELFRSGYDSPRSYSTWFEIAQIFGLRGNYSTKELDLSSNSLTGEIPEEITKHDGLQVLNLSRNQLEGSIPSGIGNMASMEALDLSKNQLTCSIPSSLSKLSSLSHLNVSYNNLSGEIPFNTHIQSFEASSYMGNDYLCGPPVAQSCSALTMKALKDQHCRYSEEDEGQEEEDNMNLLETPSFHISMVLGYVFALGAFFYTLLLKTSWRLAYFGFLDRMSDNIYVTIAVATAKLRRKFLNE
ncbi:receptor-like protein EIX1 [Senna tora]|uniref:Receptor-like protein EIX1 n=1 Tax=Senna tora TaxID=362788 RepID=A0A835CIP5_9FABA|nr:receptor-like protein EIX1 [Senna tora]